jgi:hypothetical protein
VAQPRTRYRSAGHVLGYAKSGAWSISRSAARQAHAN